MMISQQADELSVEEAVCATEAEEEAKQQSDDVVGGEEEEVLEWAVLLGWFLLRVAETAGGGLARFGAAGGWEEGREEVFALLDGELLAAEGVLLGCG